MKIADTLNELSILAQRRAEIARAEAKIWEDFAGILRQIERAGLASSAPPPPVRAAAKSPNTLSAHEAAAYLGLSASTLAKWRVTGGGPEYVKIRRRVTYRREVLDRFLDHSTFRSTSGY